MEEKKPNDVKELEDFLNEDDFIEGDDDKEAEGEGDDAKESNEDETASEEKPSDEEKEKEKAKNAEFAKKRREREAKEKAEREKAERLAYEDKIRKEAALNAKLGMLKTNPYTDEPIVDEEDLKIYELQKELDDEGKDPVADLPKRLAEVNRKRAKELAEKTKKDTEEAETRRKRIGDEISELRNKYPKVNTAELAKDELFREVSQGRFGRWSLTEIYERYIDEKSKREEKEKEEKAKEKAKEVTKAPSSQNRGVNSPAKKVEDMTDEEFLDYYNKKYHR